MRDFPRRSSRRARARRELRARGTRAGARFARLRARASVDRASPEVPRVSRRARAAQRGTAALTCRVRFDEHPKAPSAFEARASAGSVLESFPQGVSLSRPFGFPERDPRERKPERKLLVSPRNKALAASRSTRSGFLDPRGTRFSSVVFVKVPRLTPSPPHCARAAAQDGGRVLAQLLARRPGPRPELRGKVRSRSALGRACLDARPPFPPLAQKRAQGTLESRPPLAPRARRAPPLTRADPRSLETQVTPHRRSRLADPQRSLEVRRAAPSPPPRA